MLHQTFSVIIIIIIIIFQLFFDSAENLKKNKPKNTNYSMQTIV